MFEFSTPTFGPYPIALPEEYYRKFIPGPNKPTSKISHLWEYVGYFNLKPQNLNCEWGLAGAGRI